MVMEIWNHYKNRKDCSPEQMLSKRETRSNKHKPREHCMSYSWWILMVADRNCSKTVPPNKYMAHIFCLLDLQDDPMFSWSEHIICNLPTDGILLLFSPQESCKWMWWSLGQCRVGRSLCWTGRTRSENNFGSWNTIKSSVFTAWHEQVRGSFHHVKNTNLQEGSFWFAFIQDVDGEKFHLGRILIWNIVGWITKCAEVCLRTELEGKCMAFQ